MITQQVLLRDAMRRLDMTRDAFADRIGSRRRALDSWLLPDESNEFRAMPEVARRFVQEILANAAPRVERLDAKRIFRNRAARRPAARCATCCPSTSSPANRPKTCSAWPT